MAIEQLGIGTRVKHAQFGDGILCKITLEYLSISFFKGGLREIERNTDELEIIEVVPAENNVLTFDEVEDAIIRILRRYSDPIEKVDIAQKWIGGTLVFEPKDRSLQGKEVPIDTFFHKIVMVRDRLRVLEQNINSHPKLEDAEKVQLQQYITRIYGSLTTFNVLFKSKDDYFVGDSKG
jgi:hypothetical protein